MIAGLPGTGKSRLAQGLAASPAFRDPFGRGWPKELAGPLSAPKETRPRIRESLYTVAWNERTYGECLHRAEQLLFEGQRVIVDATFREEKKRQTFLNAALRCGVPALILLCRAEPETVRRRLEQRKGDVSDADWSIYLQIAAKCVRRQLSFPFSDN